ncbi:uncharacterized protein LOC124369337 isoform X2 [Homalodisca vitripennis]|uniref:uncharacterized protein LOC124369337 isoform X2 n=1 Tax=Homalodisca vitripennis TaxID=197043 RepID=UPI001EEBC3C2|nr:uncharacterized protein LOC124369337 isoform X2 [Homalodisca vitripennis]
MSSRSSGYSNAAYCTMYDNDDQESCSMYQCDNETFVDDVFYDHEPERSREPPLGASGSFRFVESRSSTPSSTPRKQQQRRRQRSFSAPRNQNTMSVLAPMIAQARCNQQTPGIRRSRSAVFCKESEDRRTSLGDASDARDLSTQRGHPTRRTISVGQQQGYRVSPARPYCEPRPRDTSLSVYDLRSINSSFCQKPRQCLIAERKSSANLAIIPPNTRPLLSPSPLESPTKKGSWAALPSRPTNNTLWLSGLFLLFTSTVNCLLCFYLLAKKGRHYYIDLAVISGFALLVLGFVGMRMGRWEWFLNRNYLAGYMVLSMLDVLLCAVLGLLASDWRPPDLPEIVEIASGAVCGLSALMLLLALCLGASSCCRNPPPDNRVAHSVPSFIV